MASDIANALMKEYPFLQQQSNAADTEYSPHLRAFGAGFVSPFGLTESVLNALSGYLPEQNGIEANRLAGLLREYRSESPLLAGAGSGTSSAMGTMALQYLRPATGLASFMSLRGADKARAFAKDVGSMAPAGAQAGLGIGGLIDMIAPYKQAPRPQSEYPSGGF